MSSTARRRSRVLMLLENNPYPQDVRVRNEAETLAGAGWEVTVLAPRDPGQPRRDRVNGVAVRRFALPRESRSPASFLLEYAIAHVQLFGRALAQLARGARIVHLHNPPDTLFPIGLLARMLGGRMVYDHHDLFPELFEEKFGGSPVVRVLRAATAASARSANLVIATNESQRDLLTELTRGDGRVAVVRNGPRADTLRRAHPARGGEVGDPRLVFLGSVASQDGVEELPRLLATLQGEGLTASLTVVGDGPARAGLEEAFARDGLADSVTFTGWVTHERVPELVAEADICVDPAGCSDLNHRSTMIKITEYLGAARPIVAYELLETRRSAGSAALYAPCGDSAAFARHVARLAGDPALRAELAARGRERADELTWERSAETLLAAYAELV